MAAWQQERLQGSVFVSADSQPPEPVPAGHINKCHNCQLDKRGPVMAAWQQERLRGSVSQHCLPTTSACRTTALCCDVPSTTATAVIFVDVLKQQLT
jgi:hypothetical protein